MKSTKTNNRDINTSISEKMQQHMQSLQFFDDSIDDYIYIYDLTSERVFFTDKIREKFPIPPAGEKGNPFSDWNDIVYPKDRKLMDYYRKLLIERKITSFNIAYRIIDRGGNKVWVKVKGTLRIQEGSQSLLIVGRISEMLLGGMVDGLTGLCSAEKFMEDMKQHLEESKGYLMVLDVDNLKNINITQGRDFGDRILKKVANILDANIGYPMELYRLDGDCFAVNFNKKQKKEVQEFYDFIKRELKDICTISAGAVHYSRKDAMDSSGLYLYAETALDQAKKEGKNKLIFFSAIDYQKNLEKVELMAEMKTSIKEGCKGFRLQYQPQIRSQDCSLYGVEALLRYDSASRGSISPIEFIPLLEQTGLICTVGQWVLKNAVLQCKKWRESIPNMHISVNMSYVQLQQEGIADIVLKTLEEAKLPGDALTLELTESIQLQNYLYFNKIFYIWKEHGIKISIDDFGTGYSSLSYLKRIEIDEVKIDRCFVDHVQYNAYNFRLLSNMIELAHSANIEVCCEGVETIEELMVLQELHTDFLQGYLFAEPYDPDSFEKAYIYTDSEAYQSRESREQNICRLQYEENEEFLQELRNEEIGNIVESMDEIVYVSDVETYELYYLNAAGRRITGVYDYKGCKCYKVLQGRDKPCGFCTNAKLCKDKFLIWERENKFLGKHFILKDKLIPWKGRMARVEMAFDITEREILSQSIRKKLNFKKAIVDACRLLASEEQMEESFDKVLKIMGEFCKGDRAYILKISGDGKQLDLNWEWCSKGRESLKKIFPVDVNSIENKKSRIENNRIITQIVRNKKTVGFIGVDNPKYKEEGTEIAKIVASFIGYSIVNAENPV